MKAKRYARLLVAMVLLLSLAAGLTHAQGRPEGTLSPQAVLGTVFTYQGRLTDGGSLASGAYDFLFTLYDADDWQFGPPISREDVQVTDGLFTVHLDFGDYAFLGWERYLEIGVRPGDSEGDYTTLSPRQPLTAAPFALSLPGLFTLPNDFSPNVIGGYAGNSVWEDLVGATISGGGGDEMENVVTDRFCTVGGGGNNVAGDESEDTTDAWFATVGGGWQNRATSYNATVAGGAENSASGGSSFVGGGWLNVASGENHATVCGGGENEASGDAATVGGGSTNTAGGEYNATVGGGYGNTANASDSTVGGGNSNTADGWAATVSGGYTNTITAGVATIGGGEANTASGDHATISGGESNVADGLRATVGGGRDNVASANATTIGGGGSNEASNHYATIGGGGSNAASGNSSAVGGGQHNSASADYATVGGGASNTAAGFAAMVGGGRGNEANEDHSVVAGGYWNVSWGITSTISGGQQNFINRDYATIGGGRNNQIYADYGTIGGGGGEDSASANIVYDNDGTIAGGRSNTAGTDDSDLHDASSATVGGGFHNHAQESFATVGGGDFNVANGLGSTVSGGFNNMASGSDATVPGGAGNLASGDYSFAAGYQAQAKHEGSFVWADHQDGQVLESTAPGQFLIRASGGVGIGTDNPGAPLHIVDGDWAEIELTATDPADDVIMTIRATGGFLDHGVVGTASWHDLSLVAGGAEKMAITAGGRVGIGTDSPQAKLDVAGTTRTEVLQITGGSDLAEPFEIGGDSAVKPGMVVAIDPDRPGQLRISDAAYDHMVAGCISGANGVKPGLIMQQEGIIGEGAYPVALTGRVYCWADAAYGPIQPGDLLTTSGTAGHIMAVSDHQQAQGAIIGKAMSSLAEGRGLVLVLVSLQ